MESDSPGGDAIMEARNSTFYNFLSPDDTTLSNPEIQSTFEEYFSPNHTNTVAIMVCVIMFELGFELRRRSRNRSCSLDVVLMLCCKATLAIIWSICITDMPTYAGSNQAVSALHLAYAFTGLGVSIIACLLLISNENDAIGELFESNLLVGMASFAGTSIFCLTKLINVEADGGTSGWTAILFVSILLTAFFYFVMSEVFDGDEEFEYVSNIMVSVAIVGTFLLSCALRVTLNPDVWNASVNVSFFTLAIILYAIMEKIKTASSRIRSTEARPVLFALLAYCGIVAWAPSSYSGNTSQPRLSSTSSCWSHFYRL